MKIDQEMPALWDLISSGEEFARLPHEQTGRPEDPVFQTLRPRSPADRLLWLERGWASLKDSSPAYRAQGLLSARDAWAALEFHRRGPEEVRAAQSGKTG